jgi:ABC-type transport system involved in multi-copper enzyme maturation, permease component
MSGFFVFFAKEMREQVKTFKGPAVFLVLLFFGMISPLMAKLTPEIVKLAAPGYPVRMPAPTFLDAYTQFFKNIGEIGIIVALLIYAGTVVTETTRGTAALMLTKRLSRSAFVLAKFLSAAVVWTVSYACAAALCVVYTVYLFPKGNPAHLLAALCCMELFGVVTIAAAVLASAVFKGFGAAAIGGFAVWGALLLTLMLPKVKTYTPALLDTENLQILQGSVKGGTVIAAVLLGVALTAALLTLACALFRQREL